MSSLIFRETPSVFLIAREFAIDTARLARSRLFFHESVYAGWVQG